MLDLDWEQMQHAIGISGSRMATLGAVTAGKLTMMKNTVDPMATQSGVLAALLAEKGYTGPEHVIDGKEGLVHCMGPEWKLELLEDGLGDGWRITQCGMKAFPTEALTHAPISCVLDLVKDNDLAPERGREGAHPLAGPGRRHPGRPVQVRPALQGDGRPQPALRHRRAVAERQVTPLQFTDEKIMDPTIRAQLNKVEVVADPEIEALFPELQRVIVKITTTDGRGVHQADRLPQGRSAQSADRRGDRGEVRRPGRAGAERRAANEAQGQAVWSLDELDRSPS